MGAWNMASSSRLVALAGRVPVKVSLENGPIEVGDLLTSASSTPGVAMKATGPGRVIGMALEPLSEADFQNCNIENSLKIENCELKIGRVMVFVNPHWYGGFLGSEGEIENGSGSPSSTESQSDNQQPTDNNEEPTILDQFALAIKNVLEKLGLFLENGIAKIKELFAEKVTTKQVCVEGEDGETICLDKAQLKEIMTKDKNSNSNNQNSDNQPSQESSLVCDSEHLELCDSQEKCQNANLYWYDDACHKEPKEESSEGSLEKPSCLPNWQCSDWQPLAQEYCTGQQFSQTRTCQDLNNCQTEEGKPAESQEVTGTKNCQTPEQ
jgi:hypothetical protein